MKRNRTIFFSFLILILLILRNYIRYILFLFGQEDNMNFIYFPGNTGFIFDILSGIFILYIDIRGFNIQLHIGGIKKEILKIVAVVFIIICVMCIWPYELINSIMKNLILDPAFSFFMNQQSFIQIVEMREEGIDILYETFLWHFYMTEGTFMEVIVIYVSFAVSSMLKTLHSFKCSKLDVHLYKWRGDKNL